LNGRPGFLAQAVKNNCLYLGLENRVVLFDYSREEILWDGPEILPHVRTAINDGIGTTDGLIFGTKDLQFKDKLAHLYAFDSKSGELRTLADGQTCSNGKVLMAGKSNTYLLDIDTPTKQLRRYDIDPESGDLADPQTVIDLQDRKDFPDGMRLSPDSKSVVIAFYNPADVDSGKAIQFNINSGQMEIEWILPNSPRVTCPEFVRIDGETKIVFTTADEGLSPDQQTMHSEAGSLFIGDYPSHDMPQTRPKAPLPFDINGMNNDP